MRHLSGDEDGDGQLALGLQQVALDPRRGITAPLPICIFTEAKRNLNQQGSPAR